MPETRFYKLDRPADVDRMPCEARLAVYDSNLIGVGHPGLRVAAAPGAIMAERIRRADARLSPGTNLYGSRARMSAPDCTLVAINAILCGKE